ncbi:hypothetical protein [Rhizobium leguminosarum]|uniref:PD-(D/E)XK nuclease domain-containing protein n=1 Tax=Rhizobium leguminosarum TaxID=384 RepID=UPI001030C049|nr:hypothetical protein [Rhizobium leguminosarum]TBG52581.1 hypothetical protein ELG74_36405 [Rhizobium leguminosarum]
MNEIVWSVTAQTIAAAAAVLRARHSWPDTATGFAFLICDHTGSKLPPFMAEPLRKTTPLALRRTPELASYGFAATRADADLRADWIEGLDNLRGREIFPADRQSFIFNPVEVLGIASGIVSFESPDLQRDWYAETLKRALSEGRLVTLISKLAVKTALGLISASPYSQGGDSEIDLRALSTSELILVSAMELAYQPPDFPRGDKLQEALVGRFLKESVRIGDAMEAVTSSIVAHRISERPVVSGSQDPVELIVSHCRRFPLFARQLATRQRSRQPFEVQDEYDVQDALHAILLLSFDDVRPEEHTPSYASSSSRIDFFLPKERIIVEAKMTRKSLGQKKVVDELLIDCARYSRMPDVDHLICVIYDPAGECKNPTAIEGDIERSGSRLNVRVVVCPRGV